MSVSKLSLRLLSVLAIFLITAFGAAAQYRGGLQGTVTDPQGAVVSGAKVTVTALETGISQEATTDDNGVYSVNRLAPGAYSVSIEKTGFKKKVVDSVTITPEQTNSLNLSLEVGQVTESVTVSGSELPAIDTESGTIAGTISTKQIQALPSFGRDVFQLAQLTPGAFGDGAQQGGGGSAQLPGTNSSGSGASDGIFKTENAPQIIANGSQLQQNNITLDGVGITSVSWGGAAVITPNEESVKEVKVVTNNYDAEYGRFGGAQIQVISQNGTNDYHGSIFIKNSQPGFNAYQRWNGATNNVQKNTAKFNQIGGSVGGPILKNKLFAFFSYETIRNSSTSTGNGWYETPQLLTMAPSNSIANQFLTYPGEGASYSQIISNAATSCTGIGLTEGVNCATIPGQGLDIGRPLASALGTADPSWSSNTNPGLGGDGLGGANNLDGVPDIMYVSTVNPSSLTEAQWNGRIDFTPTSRDLIAFSIYWVPVDSTNYNGPVRAANLWHHSATNQAMTALWDHTFSPTLINEVRVNAAGWRWNEITSNSQEPWGLPNSNISKIGSADFGNAYYGPPGPSVFDQWTYNAKDILTKVHGSHTMKFGGEVTKLLFVQEAPWSARPNYYFRNFWDFLNDAPYQENGTFDPLTGIPASFRKDTRSTLLGLFFQDSYKVKPNLTVTMGLRYEYFGPLSEKNGNLSTMELGAGSNVLTDLSFRKGGNLYQADLNDFGPQLGFAWSPNSVFGHDLRNRLVVRGGFGIGFTGEEEAITLNGSSNPPFLSFAGALTGSQILYQPASDINCFTCYPSNPNTLTSFNANNIPISGSAIGGTGFPAAFPTPYTYRYSLEGQYELGANWIATLGYQGSQSRHLTRQYNLNDIYGAQGIALNSMINDVDWYANDANANFNAFLAQIEHRFSRTFQVDGQYRWAHSRDQGSQPYSVSYYTWDPKLAWGDSDWDIRNAFKVWGVWQPKFFHSDKAWVEKIVGGWSLSGIFNWHSGFPWTPVYSQTLAAQNICNLIYNTGCGGAPNGSNWQLLPAQYLGGATSSQGVDTFKKQNGNFTGITTTAGTGVGDPFFVAPTYVQCNLPFPQTCAAPQVPGIGRNTFRGARYLNLDATISKSFGLPKMPVLGENAAFEFRANVYNLFNNLNVTNIQNVINSTYFGAAQNGMGSRTMELQARFSF